MNSVINFAVGVVAIGNTDFHIAIIVEKSLDALNAARTVRVSTVPQMSPIARTKKNIARLHSAKTVSSTPGLMSVVYAKNTSAKNVTKPLLSA